ncbi:DENN domain-containing protein [Escovopsis weberi]|uniref:DENN domain-containing protein n=1 Tax=Escovopsis weberi TaxID=150374 RepID=A0A0M9VXI0_ESCWE|nr:DENN domain-containing protein [Escovopsis weberi]
MEGSTVPLAEYFWIAGIETIAYEDAPPSISHPVGSTIVEDNETEDGAVNGSVRNTVICHSRQNSANRFSKIDTAVRHSIHTLEEVDGNTASNRSSATIKASTPASPNGPLQLHGEVGLMGDFDFDKALWKFASERENFLEDLSFTAGAKQSRPPMVIPRAERIKNEDADQNGRVSPLRSIKGSIRRKISFRDMNSMRKQPSTARASSQGRAARRLSNYNSVIPPPEPLNTDPDMHPLKRRFEPVLLDRYPPKNATEEVARRGRFPDYVPMFAFPNDVQIVSSDDRPRSTWHGFTMTSDDNSKLYGITIIIWTALPADVAEIVETKCEDWRQSHMSNEERELAASLGLEEEIGSVEEKISLMTDMLRPLRHGAASKIEGLTTGESGLWAPRAYGILGRDPANMPFWKEWLKAIVVPMTDGAILRVPASSPKVGRWQPLERYVVNLCTEAFGPMGSKTQVELGVRDLRLFARKEAANELPGSRTTDLYALFRCLSLENIVTLFEFAMSESRIIFLSSHTSMLHLACHALASLLYPLKWASIFIPVLPARLISALEAPCPYIVGVERRYERIDLPEDDYVLVDLDGDTIDATSQPVRLPRQHRRKLMSLLQVAAPHKLRYGVTTGPPPLPFLNGGHQPNMSISSISVDSQSSFGGGYAPSTYAASTLAASTIMPNMQIQPVRNTETTVWVEGHCFNLNAKDTTSTCTICDEKAEGDGFYKCGACKTVSHGRCLGFASLVCPEAFRVDRVRAAFVRCLASLLYTYRKYLGKPSKQQKENGQLFAFDMEGFIKSLPYEQQDYAIMMRDTQAFNEFIHDREMKPQPEESIRLFDEIIMAKKARGRSAIPSGLSRLSTIRASHASSWNLTPPGRGGSSNSSSGGGSLSSGNGRAPAYLTDMSEHIWRTASVPLPKGSFPGEYRSVVTRIPARLDRSLMREPRAIQGMPRVEQRGQTLARKQVPGVLSTTPPT